MTILSLGQCCNDFGTMFKGKCVHFLLDFSVLLNSRSADKQDKIGLTFTAGQQQT